jgi:vitamin B12 transporter
MRFCILLCFGCFHFVFAQNEDTTRVTNLREVTVYGMPVSRYAAGTKREPIFHADNPLLDQALLQVPSVYFKTYGNGQLSSIALRGTSAAHTAVLWNGININSPMLGQTDFSLLPTYLLEDITLQYGAAGSQYGSAAIGGTVLLNQASPRFEQQVGASIKQEIGSFGNIFTGVKFQVANNRWEVRTKSMTRTLENNFSYASPAVGKRRTQDNASIKQYGFDQQIHFKISEKQMLALEVMQTHNYRDIQPSVLVTDSHDNLTSENVRANLSYTGTGNFGDVYLSAGYNQDELVYNKSDRSRTDQLIALFNVDKSLNERVSVRYGASWKHFITEVQNYAANLREDHYDAFASINYAITPNWIFSGNARQSWYAGRHAPFSPSVGTEYVINASKKNQWRLRTQFSRGYRVPTLNDRYWNPGGNPNLKPENAWQGEAGFEWVLEKGKRKFQAGLTGFSTYTDQWIIWLPSEHGYWAPSNLQKVNAAGLEASFKTAWKFARLVINQGVTYSYTSSKNRAGLTPGDDASVNKQLPYVPLHSARLYCKSTAALWSAEFNVEYTGLRYTTLDNLKYQSLEPYVLSNFSLEKLFRVNKFSWVLQGRIQNLFNVYYENVQHLAMPGRNYLLSLTINFNHPKS